MILSTTLEVTKSYQTFNFTYFRVFVQLLPAFLAQSRELELKNSEKYMPADRCLFVSLYYLCAYYKHAWGLYTQAVTRHSYKENPVCSENDGNFSIVFVANR